MGDATKKPFQIDPSAEDVAFREHKKLTRMTIARDNCVKGIIDLISNLEVLAAGQDNESNAKKLRKVAGKLQVQYKRMIGALR